MRGNWYASRGVLSRRDLEELADLLTCRIYQRIGRRAYALTRRDIAELIEPYVNDLSEDDRHSLTWIIWDLLQEGAEIEFT